MAFVVKINGTNRSLDVDAMLLCCGYRAMHGMTGTKFGCGLQNGSSDTIVINKVRSL